LTAFEPGALFMDFLTVREPIDGNIMEWQGDIIDVVGWANADPGTWWRFTRAADALGHDELRLAHWEARPARICDSPLDWLQAGCEPFLILDWWQDWYSLEFTATAAVCQSQALAQRLRKHLPGYDIRTATATSAWRCR